MDQLPLFRREPVKARRDERVQGRRDFQRFDRPRELVRGTIGGEQPSVQQHAHGLDRVQRDAFGARQDRVSHIGRQARHEALEQLLHRLRRQRLEIQRR